MVARHPILNKTVIGLVIIGTLLLGLRFVVFQDNEPTDDSSWLITMSVEFTARSDQTVVSISPPFETPHHRIVRRTIQHAGLRPKYSKTDRASRMISMMPRNEGQYMLLAEFEIQTSKTARFYKSSKVSYLNDKQYEEYLEKNEQIPDAVYEGILEKTSLSEAEKVEALQGITNYLFNLKTVERNTAITLHQAFESNQLTRRDKAELLVALSRWLHIPARMVTGLILNDDPDAQPSYWAEIFLDNKWHTYHPNHGYLDTLPTKYIALNKKGQGLLVTQKLDELAFTVQIEQLPDNSSTFVAQAQKQNWYDIFNFNRLSAELRQQLVFLIMLPLGALITAFIRHFVGIHSYGVFTPTILALAMIYSDSITTYTILFVTIVAVYLGRPAFHSSVNRTPRLSIIFTFVAVSMLLSVSLLDFLSLGENSHLILLPIVIITTLIDRYFAAVEVHGNTVALVRLAWTALISMMILPLLQFEWLGYKFLTAPELHLYTTALLLIISEYEGKKLIEHKYFSVLDENNWKSKSSSEKKNTKSSMPESRDEND